MMKLIAPAAALAAALALASCGGGGGSGSSSAGASSAAGSDTSSKTVSVRQLAGVGSVLVDQSGKALYSSDVEASGKIVCSSGACAAFWKPLTADGGKPTGPATAGKLGMIKRPDGSQQVTANGKPLYTFSEDSPGKATGNNFTDDFDGHHFTWNVVQAGGKTAAGAGGGNAPSHPDSSNYGGGY
jgi:predicted lipoprotein with Yx(FWY)xxD motif